MRFQKKMETANHGGNRRGVRKRNEDRKWKDEASEAEEGRKRVKEEKAGGGETASMEGNETRGGGKRGKGGLSARGRGFKRNQFRVAVQSNVTPAAAGVNVGRNSNFTPGPW